MASYNRGGRGQALRYLHTNAASDQDTLINLFAKNASSTTTENKCDTAGADEVPVGIVNDIDPGKNASVVITGHAKLRVTAGSVNIAPGDPIKVGTGGKGVKATVPGEEYFAVAQTAATANDAIIDVIVERGVVKSSLTGLGTLYVEDADGTAEVTAANLAAADHVVIELSVAGASALALPAASAANKGKKITWKKRGSAGAITATPATGTIDGASNHTAADALNDSVTVVSNGAGNWLIIAEKIAP